MQRYRTIAGPPERTATAAWQTVSSLIANTLAASAEVAGDAVSTALSPLQGIGPALIAAGHLETAPLVLVGGPLHVSITVVTGAAVTTAEENLSPVPGGASATADWVLYLPNPASFSAALSAAVAKSRHLSLATPPTESNRSSEAGVKASMVDLTALQGLRASS
ncbi:hypothetical protein Rhe02_92930 [Rhizocola hellebori]|uniref:Uncharacterized protein n=1 Tax=Rhizocola hellebori TaxID=1392758 RepID=A0A8J3QLF2_9ACTN|nr:hypothetical protein [Rhizocola hellebori]GIH11226.1 hypothetical protein Rhe02_92930 [Rhizocola hellebori]